MAAEAESAPLELKSVHKGGWGGLRAFASTECASKRLRLDRVRVQPERLRLDRVRVRPEHRVRQEKASC